MEIKKIKGRGLRIREVFSLKLFKSKEKYLKSAFIKNILKYSKI